MSPAKTSLVSLVVLLSLAPPRAHRVHPARDRISTSARRARLPVRFEENTGQVDARARFVARRGAATLFLTGEGATLSMAAPRDEHAREAVLRLKVSGGRSVTPEAEQRLVTTSHYLVGDDPAGWRTFVPNFGRVVYRGVLEGVDLVFHGEEGQLEYDFVVAPGADAGAIALEVTGAEELSLTPKGDLAIRTDRGVLVQPKPRVYQRSPSGEVEVVAAEYTLSGARARAGARVGFTVAAYDRSRELVIDPVIEYSTFVGGAGLDHGDGIAVDHAGSAYLVGSTESPTFPSSPTQPPPAGVRLGSSDVFVAKLSAAGDALVYVTYLGGTGQDDTVGGAIAVDGAGRVFVTGRTFSSDFPTRPPGAILQAGLAGSSDAFVAKLTPDGSALEYSTYLGGSSDDLAHGVALDQQGSAYVVGDTDSVDFPTRNPFRTASRPGAYREVFVSKLSPAGDSLEYSTYLGGSGGSSGQGIAVDSAQSAYVTGYTSSTLFPTRNALQPAHAGGQCDVFVAKLSKTGTSLVYGTYLGGAREDSARGIAVDARGSAYVTGHTSSSGFPTRSPLQAKNAGGNDAFVTKLSPEGTSLVYSTFLGGADLDRGIGIAVDSSGSAYVTGVTNSETFPTRPAAPPAGPGGLDLFVAKLSPRGDSLVAGGTLGGPDSDLGQGIAVDSAGAAYVTGATTSAAFLTERPVQGAHGGGDYDAFVTKWASEPPPAEPTAPPVVPEIVPGPAPDRAEHGSARSVDPTPDDDTRGPRGCGCRVEPRARAASSDRGPLAVLGAFAVWRLWSRRRRLTTPRTLPSASKRPGSPGS